MSQIDRLNGSNAAIQLDFVEREATPRELMELRIQHYLAKLSLSYTVAVLERYGVKRARSTVHIWVQKADLQPTDGKHSDHAVLDETVIQLENQRYWLYGAVDPETNEFLRAKLYSTRTAALIPMFLAELREKHDIYDAVFLVDSAPWLKPVLHDLGLRFRYETHGNQDAVECLFQEIKRLTSQFENCFRNIDSTTVGTWLQSYAYCWNQLIRTMLFIIRKNTTSQDYAGILLSYPLAIWSTIRHTMTQATTGMCDRRTGSQYRVKRNCCRETAVFRTERPELLLPV